MSSVSMRNKRGEYVPAIPLPFYGFRKKCSCGAKFWTTHRYNEHYAYEHILMGNKPL
jgi:hypothetical protein